MSTITEADAAPFVSGPGREALAGLDFQRHIERKAAEMGGGDLVAGWDFFLRVLGASHSPTHNAYYIPSRSNLESRVEAAAAAAARVNTHTLSAPIPAAAAAAAALN